MRTDLYMQYSTFYKLRRLFCKRLRNFQDKSTVGLIIKVLAMFYFCSLATRQYSKHFVHINSLNHYKNLLRQRYHYHLHFTDEDTKAKQEEAICPNI